MKNVPAAFLLICVVSTAQSQIIYTDINPDTTVTSQGAGVSYAIQIEVKASQTIEFTAYGNEDRVRTSGSIELVVDSAYKIPVPAPSGDTIRSITTDPTNAWLLTDTVNGRTLSPNAGWFNGDQYLAFRFRKADGLHYGWVRINAGGSIGTNTFYVTVKDYAYSSLPDTRIIAGQKGPLSIAGPTIHQFEAFAYPNPANGIITITSPEKSLLGDAIAVLTDIRGREVAKASSSAGFITLTTSTLPAGEYPLLIRSGSLQSSLQIIVRH